MILKYIRQRASSFSYAFQGILTLIRTQPNARIHLAATLIVLCGGLLLHLRDWEWISLFLCMALIWLAEAMNTALEFLADEVTREKRPLIKKAKDVAAGGVLLASIFALATGTLILLRHF